MLFTYRRSRADKNLLIWNCFEKNTNKFNDLLSNVHIVVEMWIHKIVIICIYRNFRVIFPSNHSFSHSFISYTSSQIMQFSVRTYYRIWCSGRTPRGICWGNGFRCSAEFNVNTGNVLSICKFTAFWERRPVLVQKSNLNNLFPLKHNWSRLHSNGFPLNDFSSAHGLSQPVDY